MINTPEKFQTIWAQFETQGIRPSHPPEGTISRTLFSEPSWGGALGVVQQSPDDTVASTPLTGAISVGSRELPSIHIEAHTQGGAKVESGATPEPSPDFQIIKTLGRGGMGQVDLARELSLQREVAIKSLQPEHGGTSALDALMQEALFTGFLEHPNIIPVHRLGQNARGEPVMVMKRVSGIEWRALIRDAAHPRWAKVADRVRFHMEILMQVCSAVAFAHAQGVLHRDLKPENVMIGDFGEVYVLDWGIAARLGGLRTWAITGTPAYMAPEMTEVNGLLDERTDVFLLGACLHEVLTGEPLYQGASLQAVVFAAYTCEPKVYGADVPEELAALCGRACARDPAERPPSAEAFRQALVDFLLHRGSIRLAEEARGKLASLSVEVEDDVAFTRDFTECRFALQQALREWPNNEKATQLFQGCLTLGISRAINRRNPSLAASLIHELPKPDEALVRALRNLERELGEDVQSLRERLRVVEQDRDIRVSSLQRIRAFQLLCVFFALPTAWISAQQHFNGDPFTAAEAVVATGVILFICCGIVLGFWRALRYTALNRSFALFTLMVPAALFLNRLFGLFTSAPMHSVLSLDMLVGGFICASVAIALDRRFTFISLVSIGFGIVATLLPAVYALDMQVLACLAVAILVQFLWIPHQRVDSPAPREV